MVPFHQDKTVFLELPVVGGINGLPFSVTPQESKTFILRGYAFEGCAPVFEQFSKDLDGSLLLLKSHRVHQFAQRQPPGALDSTGCAAGHGYKEKGKSSLRSRGERSGPLAKAHSAGSPCRGGASGLGQGC